MLRRSSSLPHPNYFSKVLGSLPWLFDSWVLGSLLGCLAPSFAWPSESRLFWVPAPFSSPFFSRHLNLLPPSSATSFCLSGSSLRVYCLRWTGLFLRWFQAEVWGLSRPSRPPLCEFFISSLCKRRSTSRPFGPVDLHVDRSAAGTRMIMVLSSNHSLCTNASGSMLASHAINRGYVVYFSQNNCFKQGFASCSPSFRVPQIDCAVLKSTTTIHLHLSDSSFAVSNHTIEGEMITDRRF